MRDAYRARMTTRTAPDARTARTATDPNRFARFWSLDPAVTFLNHGSFGATPRAVLDRQSELRAELEAEPLEFLDARLEPRLDEARAVLARFVGSAADDLVFVPNATAGVNAVARSLDLASGDELLTTDHEYNACANVLRYVAERTGAVFRCASVPACVSGPDEVASAVLGALTDRTKLVLVDHVTSPTGTVWPVGEIVRGCRERGVRVLVDGAHAPGMLPLDLDALGADYYTANCHKWICSPKGSAFLHVRRDRQREVRPAVISHGHNSPRTDRSRFLIEFGWTGTGDPTAYLCVPAAIEHMASLVPGGWPEIMRRNRALALEGRDIVRRAVESAGFASPEVAPDAMIGSIASVTLPDLPPGSPVPTPPISNDPLRERLVGAHRVQVPVFPFPAPPGRMLRVSAQLYNTQADYERLAAALAEELPRSMRAGSGPAV